MMPLAMLFGGGLTLEHALFLASGIFCIGVYGVLSRQNVLVILMCIELMLNGANLAIVALGRSMAAATPSGPVVANQSQAFVVVVLAVAAAEAGVGLAILLAAYRRWRTVKAGEINLLKG